MSERLDREAMVALKDELWQFLQENKTFARLLTTIGHDGVSLIVYACDSDSLDELNTLNPPAEWQGVPIEYDYIPTVVAYDENLLR